MKFLARRVLIISQQALFREGIRRLLTDSPNIEELEAVHSLQETKALVSKMNPDLIIFDCSNLPFAKMDEKTLKNLFRLGTNCIASLTLANKEMVIYGRHAIHEATERDLAYLVENHER